MFAVIKTGGKQYKVAKDDEITIERLAAVEGDPVVFDEVLMLGGDGAPVVGAPRVDDAAVKGVIVSQIRGEKVYTFHKRRRKHSSKRLRGHRQYLTVVKIDEILSAGGAAAAQEMAQRPTGAGPEAGGDAAPETTPEAGAEA